MKTIVFVVVWSVAAAVVYALFPSSDTAAAIALLIWGVGVLGAFCFSDPDYWADWRAIWKDIRG